MMKKAWSAAVLGLGLSISAVVGWLFLRDSKQRKGDSRTVTVRSQVGGNGSDEMQPIVLPREALEESADDGAEETGATGSQEGDDFTLIRGIGPRFAQALRDGGVTPFAALARETPDRLAERMAPYATVTAQRIREGDWISQAKALARAD